MILRKSDKAMASSTSIVATAMDTLLQMQSVFKVFNKMKQKNPKQTDNKKNKNNNNNCNIKQDERVCVCVCV